MTDRDHQPGLEAWPRRDQRAIAKTALAEIRRTLHNAKAPAPRFELAHNGRSTRTTPNTHP